MGADYSAYAVIGILIDEDSIPLKKETVKIGNHDFPKDVLFNSKTGAALWEEEEYQEFTFDEDYHDENPKSKLIKLPKGIEIYRGTDGKPMIIGFGTGEDTYSNGGDDCDFKSLSKMPTKEFLGLKDILEPLGIWDESKYGLYSVLSCSY